MSTIHYAIEIITDVTTTDVTYGLVAGTFRFVTDRPGYTGVSSPLPTWEDTTDNMAIWYEGWLMKDGLSQPSRRVDITGTGDYGTNSGFNFNIRNDSKFWDFIQTQQIWLTNRTVKFYVVIDDRFYQTWTGVISDQPYSETDYTFVCVDKFKTVHKDMPKVFINNTGNPDVLGDSSGDPIPLTLGNVQYAKLTRIADIKNTLTVVRNGNASDTVSWGGTLDYKACGGVNYGYGDGSFDYANNLDLLTEGCYFTEGELVDKYVCAVGGTNTNKEKLIRIRANKVTTIYPSISLYTAYGVQKTYYNVTLTRIGLEDPLEYATVADFATTYRYEPNKPSYAETWFFSIIDFSVELTGSANAIVGYNHDANNRILIYTYDKTTKVFSPVDDHIASVTNTAGNIAISLKASSIDTTGQIEVVSQIPFTATTLAQAGYNVASIYDKDPTTFFRRTRSTDTKWTYGHVISIFPDLNYDFSKIDQVFIAPNIKFTSNNAGAFIDVSITARAVDVYGNIISDIPKNNPDPYYENWGMPNVGESNELNMIPKDYFTEHAVAASYVYWGGDILGADSKRLDLCKVDGEILDLIKQNRVKRIDFNIGIKSHGATQSNGFYLDLMELGFFGVKTIATLEEDLYASISGETSTSAIDVSSVYGTFNHILIDYDGISATDIDYDNLPTARSTWPVSRQITEQKNSYDYLRELAEQSFVCVFPTRIGKRKLSAWREKSTVIATHTNLTILRDSIKAFESTKIMDLYNAFSFVYHYNAATKKFDRALTVSNVDAAAFPASTDATWKTYVGGVNPTSYADAKDIWDLCHATYLKSKAINKAPASISNLSWYADQAVSGSDPTASPGVAVDNSPWLFLQNCAEWTTRQKDIVAYSLPISAANITLEMLDFINFNDAIFTNSETREGWITSISVDPRNDSLLIESTLQPIELDLYAGGLIIERGPLLNTDTITESGTQTDTITEGA